MKSKIKLSVIISLYNQKEKYITECVESIISQTYKNFELIIVDDNSKKKFLQTYKELKKLDKRIKIIYNKKRIGLNKSLNKAVKFSNSKWLVRVDSDDVILGKKTFEKKIKYLIKYPKIKVLSSLARYISYDSKKIFGCSENKLQTHKTAQTLVSEKKNVGLMCSGSFIDKNVFWKVGGYSKIFPGEDLDLWNRIAENGYQVYALKTPMVLYRIHKNQGTTKALYFLYKYLEWYKLPRDIRRGIIKKKYFKNFKEWSNTLSCLDKFKIYVKSSNRILRRKIIISLLYKEYFKLFFLLLFNFCFYPISFTKSLIINIKK